MNEAEVLGSLGATVILAWAAVKVIASRDFTSVAVTNYRGAKLNPLLGFAVAPPALLVLWWSLTTRALTDRWRPAHAGYLAVSVAAVLVLLGGYVDDRWGGKARGLRGHFRAAMSGRRPTTGIIKASTGLLAGAIVVMALPSRPWWILLAGVILMAGATNVANGLDVAPGRAGKVFLAAGFLPPYMAGPAAPRALLFLMWFAALPAVVADLRERATLGDNGSNVLGFAVGAGLYAVLPDAWVLGAAAVAVGLNIVAETVSFSRVIRASGFLRWLDRLGTTREYRRFATQRSTRRHGL